MPERPLSHEQRLKALGARPDGRPGARERGYDVRWDMARKHFLSQHPLCAGCHARGRTVAATVVDHIKPHRGDRALFWDTSNWQPLCVKCHGAKIAWEKKHG